MSEGANAYNPALFAFDPAQVYPWQVFSQVTVATLTWNRREMVERTLQALYRHAGMPFELLVVDNASTDGTREMLQQLSQAQTNVRLVCNPENVGRVRGIRQIRDLVGEGLVLYLDSDIELLSALFLVHLQKAFHAVRVAHGRPDAVLALRLVNCEEYGFRHAGSVQRLEVPGRRSGAPRSSYAAVNKDRARPPEVYAEQVLLGVSDFLLGGCWACPAPVLRAVPFQDLYPTYLGGDDGFASDHWGRMGIPMGYLENGPIARHLDWPYSDEKIALYQALAQRRAVTDASFVWWKIRRLLGRR